jgi:hypothetical protein
VFSREFKLEAVKLERNLFDMNHWGFHDAD